MKILVLGGTGFLGPEIVETLLASKHTVTLFNRGKTHKELFPELERLVGDRNKQDYKSLEGRSWDVVIDVAASQPFWVKPAVELLKKSCKTYVFVSTISVFNDYAQPGIDENGPMFPEDASLDDLKEMSMEQYGPMKVRCEALVRQHFPETATIVRPGLIVGPTDPTDRFTYWPARIDKGGEVLAPGPGTDRVQFVDVRDLGRFVGRLIDDGHVGTYNATGPTGVWSMAEFLAACKACASNPVELIWADPQWLVEQGVQPFMEMPLWVPGPEMAGFMSIDCSKAISHGLTFSPVADTVRDTIAWANKRPESYKWRAGLPSAKESSVLDMWKKRAASQPAR